MELMERIGKLTDAEIGDVLDAVLHRYAQLFPEWEVSTISLYRNEDRNKQIDLTIQMLQNLKTAR